MKISAVTANELATLIKHPVSPFLCVDTRSLMQYNDNHILGSVNICCSKIIRRKLQYNRISIQDVLKNCGCEWMKVKFAVIYDEASSWEAGNNFTCNHVLFILVQKMMEIVPNVALLEGGFSEFAYKFPKLCDSTLKSTCPLLSISTPCASGSSRHCPPTKVLPFLFLGSEEDAQSEDILQTCRVKYILNASQTAVDSPYCKSGYYLKIPIQDNSSQNIVAWFQTAFDFIDKVKESDDHVLIHCVGGVSRSATIAIAYVMRHLSLSLDNAYRYVKEKRPTISPNLNFMGQLLQYEQQLLKETNLINTPFSELNLDGLRSPTQILRKNFVLHEEIDTYHAHNTSGFPSPRSEDLVPSRALDLLPDVTGSTNIRDNRTLGYNAGIPQATCNYTTRLEVFPSPGSDDVPSPTGSELSNSSEFYDSSGSTSAPPVTNNKPLTLNLGMLKNDFHKKCPSRDFTLELGPKKKR